MYTDGACKNQGRSNATGGCGVYFGDGDPRNAAYPLPGSVQTNNRAELHAVAKAAELSRHESRPVTIVTDSQYVSKGHNEWSNSWKSNGWRTTGGQPVANQDLWRQVDHHVNQHGNIRIEHVRAHNGNPGNESADRLAKHASHW